MAWRPTATLAALRLRSTVLDEIRGYFAHAQVLEVDTPLLYRFATTDPALASFTVAGTARGRRYLQTSPEHAMKRLLAAGSGDIFQICHAFRREEAEGRLHRDEFTLLEWYRLGFDHHALMDDVARLVGRVLPLRPLERHRYAALWQAHLALDPHLATTAALAKCAAAAGAALAPPDAADRALLLDFLFSRVIAGRLGPGRAGFVYDFPLEQAAYAALRPGPPPVAERFELIIDGIEIANGWRELTAADLQRARHEQDNLRRAARGLPRLALDGSLLAALAAGLPACAGVALGFDRLLMCCAGARDIAEVLSFGAG